MSLLKVIIYLMIFFLMNSCTKKEVGGTTTGNPMNFSFTASQQARSVAIQLNRPEGLFWKWFSPYAVALPPRTDIVDAGGVMVSITKAWINMGEIEFKPLETAAVGEVVGTSVSLPGPYPVDLLSALPQVLGTASIEGAELRRVQFKLKALLNPVSGQTPAGLTNKSMFIEGTLNNGAVNFAFSTTEETEFEVGGPNSLNLSSANRSLLLSLKLANLIRKIDFSSIANATTSITIDESTKNSPLSASPCPTIDASTMDLYSCLRLGLQTESNLGKDNGVGELDPTEPNVKP